MAERKRLHRVGQETESFDVNNLIRLGIIKNELEYERAMIAHRRMRLMAKNDAKYNTLRLKLVELIVAYEKKHWNNTQQFSKEKLKESDYAEAFAEKERVFYATRKELIKKRLQELGLTQQELGELLGHRSKTHMSELMNGISQFSLKDLNMIRLILKINIDKLVPSFLPVEEYPRIITVVKKLNNPKLKIKERDLMIA